MATRGRKPKPTAMKELEGNPGKHPLNTSEPKPNKKAPACPKWLEPEAKKEWRRLAKQMEAIGILTEVDHPAAQDIYPVTDAAGEKHMLPAVPEFVKTIDIDARTILVTPIDGMFNDAVNGDKE